MIVLRYLGELELHPRLRGKNVHKNHDGKNYVGMRIFGQSPATTAKACCWKCSIFSVKNGDHTNILQWILHVLTLL